MTIATQIIPSEIADKLRSFIDDGKTGSIELDVRAGQILSCKITEYVRVAKTIDKGNSSHLD